MQCTHEALARLHALPDSGAICRLKRIVRVRRRRLLQVTHLRTKARLLVQDGATLIGVMDEFGVLQEGEVFVQVRGRRCSTGVSS